MPNQLAQETSPYLLQHAENPVDWRPWSDEAFARARAEDKPVFLSIGYSACHWCHVMAHESFEDEGIARLLNEHFVSIKVDREERPEIDQLYMEAVQMLTGHGGWPLSVFLTPDREPFFGGTYWPSQSRGGMPGFDRVLEAVLDAWRRRRDQTLQQAEQLTQLIREEAPPAGTAEDQARLSDRPLEMAEASLSRSFDPHYGGFGSAPKFPQPMALRVLLRRWWRKSHDYPLKMATATLDRMARGGIYDHLGGGFHRYSVDARWLVPHFEKMLYDNALLATCYLEAWQITGQDDYARVVRETLNYVLRDMTAPTGGFYSAEDADSEGEEGRFYLWRPEEVARVLPPQRAEVFCYVYDVSEEGNFEGRSILNLPKTLDYCATRFSLSLEQLQANLDEDRHALLAARNGRVRPGLDDKVLVSWNALMIDALAQAGAALDEPRYHEAARRAARFLLEQLRDAHGRLLHTWRAGHASLPALLDDYAGLAGALVTLYETDFEESWVDEAIKLADEVLARFADPDQGGFYYTASDHQGLIARKKDLFDASVPSSSGLATTVLLRLGRLTGRNDYLDAAERALLAAMPWMERAPTGTGQMLLALDTHLAKPRELVLLGVRGEKATESVLAALFRRYLPNKSVAYRNVSANGVSPALAALFEGKHPVGPLPTLYVCQNHACQAPRKGHDEALAALASLAESP